MDDIDGFVLRAETLARGLGSAVEHGLMTYTEADAILCEHALKSFPQSENAQHLAAERLSRILVDEAGLVDRAVEAAALATMPDFAISREIAGNLVSALGHNAAIRADDMVIWIADDGESFRTSVAKIDNRTTIITGDGGATLRQLEISQRRDGNFNGGYVDYAISRIREEADGLNATSGAEIISVGEDGRIVIKVPIPDDTPSTKNILTAGEATLFLVGKIIAIREGIVAEIATAVPGGAFDPEPVDLFPS